MPHSEALPPPRPDLVFRVGITGARTLPPDLMPALRRSVQELLSRLRDAVRAVATDPVCTMGYRQEGGRLAAPLLRLVSPLAEGADRLVAEEALRLGFQLSVVLPFPREEYEQDFGPASRSEFEVLLAQAVALDGTPTVMELDGARAAEGRSYQAAGRMVVRNCDLLIAIWDGEPARGRGGTEEIIRFALRTGPPVWWIDARAEGPGHWLDRRVLRRSEGEQRAALAQTPAGGRATQELELHLRAVLCPPLPSYPEPRSVPGRVLARIGCRREQSVDWLTRFLGESEIRQSGLWHLHHWVINAAAPHRPRPPRAAARPPCTASPPAAAWIRAYRSVDRLSETYADRYRSSYILVFLLAALALICAVLMLERPEWRIFATSAELAVLLAIALLVWVNDAGAWHERWIDYRLLAELCRKQQALALLGWSLPAFEVTRVAERSAARSNWIGWYFNAVMRMTPLPAGLLAGPQLQAARSGMEATLMTGQVDYHAQRRARCEEAGRTLGHLGALAFLVTLVCVSLKFVLLLAGWDGGPPAPLELLAILAPVSSAAFFGIRAYAELELLADQSHRMEVLLRDAQHRLDELRLDAPLASQELAGVLYDLAIRMLADVDGWAQLFQLKAVELA